MKKSSVFKWHKWFKELVMRMWKMMKKVVIQDLRESMKMLEKCRTWCNQTDI